MTGAIVMWSGAIVDIPDGWVLCDGNNGSPDLRDRFVIGAGDTYAVDATGGAPLHNHDFTGDGHNHSLPFAAYVGTGPPNSNITTTRFVTGTTDNGVTLPPFYALAYIMKT